MDSKVYDLARYRLAKSNDDLESAKLNFRNHLLSQSINRSYYAIFHSVKALLAFEKFDSKKHSGIIAYFNQNFIKTNKIEKKYSEILVSAERIRINTDYNDFYIVDKEQAETQLTNAEKFANKMKEYISQNYITS